MSAALLIALALAGGGRFERVNSRTEQGRSDRGLMSSSGALFEFAPVNGAGMGTACACTAVTGSKGETLTFSRASVGSCIKGSTTALASGDMVICASGQPRVMPGGDGTGGLGLLVEGAGTNVVTRSEALDNAAYADYTAGGAAAPVVTADFDYSPTSTLTADWLQIPATTAAQSSGRSIAVLTAAAYSVQVYVGGGSSGWAGDIDLCVETSGGATCATCGYDAAWRPCKVENVTSIAGGRVFVGNLSELNGGTARSAADVLVWGLDAKLGAATTSYVPTAGSAVARASDVATIDLGPTAPAANNFSAAATKVGMGDSEAPLYSGWLGMSTISTTDVSNRGMYAYKVAVGAVVCSSANDATTVFASGAVVTTPNLTPQRWACWSGGAIQGDYKGTAMSASAAQTGVFSPARYVTIGSIASAFATNGVVSRICIDPDPTRCR